MKQSSCGFFGIRVDGLDINDVVLRVESSPSRPYWIVTANPEILLSAKRDPAYAETLKQADLRIVDGFGLKLFGPLFGARLARTTGVDLVYRLAKWAAEKSLPIALIGGEHPDAAAKSLAALKARFPALRGFSEAGGTVNVQGEGDIANDEARMRIALQDPAVIFVAFGHPKQERWIERYRDEFPNARVIVGVGGAFNYISGILPRAPRWIRAIGLEWLYRLITEPKRWRRIWNAVVVFPAQALLYRIRVPLKRKSAEYYSALLRFFELRRFFIRLIILILLVFVLGFFIFRDHWIIGIRIVWHRSVHVTDLAASRLAR